MITRHVCIRGRVQGVFFRDHTKKMALHYRLTGWVRNLADGSVETVLRGEREMVGKMLVWLKEGSPLSTVTDVFVSNISINDLSSTFEIRY